MEEYEDMVRMFEQNNEELLKDSEAKLKTTRVSCQQKQEMGVVFNRAINDAFMTLMSDMSLNKTTFIKQNI